MLTSLREPIRYMHIIKRKTLIDFYKQPGRKDAMRSLEAWYYEVGREQWASPADVKERYRSASILNNNLLFLIFQETSTGLSSESTIIRRQCLYDLSGRTRSMTRLMRR